MRLLLKEELKSMGYNAKERAYVYSGAFVGAIAPIVCARYVLFNAIKTENWVGETIAWGGALMMNAGSMLFSPHLPVSFYTGLAGMLFGTIGAESSKSQRFEKERNLEYITKEVSE